jgi:hypothetical protein
MSIGMDETFAAAFRELLVEQAQAQADHAQSGSPRRRRMRWPRRWSVRLGVTFGVLASGGGIAAATDAVLSSGLPGSQKVTPLAGPVTVTGDGTETVQLGTAPAGTNAIYTYLSCLTPGTFEWPDGASLSCFGQTDVANTTTHPAIYTLPLSSGQTSIKITAASGQRWRLTARYVTTSTIPWGINASGQTYGTVNYSGTPDLVAAVATNGRSGYVYATELMGPQPTTPSQALASEHSAPRTVTVYESDGKTPIGQFTVATGGDLGGSR